MQQPSTHKTSCICVYYITWLQQEEDAHASKHFDGSTQQHRTNPSQFLYWPFSTAMKAS
jgi:hypothetical protein